MNRDFNRIMEETLERLANFKPDEPAPVIPPGYASIYNSLIKQVRNTASHALECRRGPTAIDDVAAERARQDAKWGGPAHDDQHSTAEFVQLIIDYAGWSRVMYGMNSQDRTRRRLIQVAALAVAAVESIDRKTGRTPS